MSARQRLARRFVVWSEVFGYALCLLVFAGVAATALIDVDVTTPLSGEIHRDCSDLTAGADVVVVEYTVADGERVSRGQPVIRAIREHIVQKQWLARATVAASLASVESEMGPDSDASVRLRRALAQLPEPAAPETVTAPRDGAFLPVRSREHPAIVPRGSPLARICGERFVAVVLVDRSAASRIVAGQAAAAFVTATGETLSGRVASVRPLPRGVEVRVEFASILPRTLALLRRDHVSDAQARTAPAVQLNVTVDRRSLFTEMLRRGR